MLLTEIQRSREGLVLEGRLFVRLPCNGLGQKVDDVVSPRVCVLVRVGLLQKHA